MSDKFGLICDWETSGLLDDNNSFRTFLEGPQGIEIGAILVTLPEFNVIEEFQSKVKFLGAFNNKSYGGPLYNYLTWSIEAEQIHGIAIETLIDAPTPFEVAQSLLYMTQRHIKSNEPLMLCGHNPTIDMYNTKQLMFLGGRTKEIRFHYRMIDTFSIGNFLYGIKNSNDLFKQISSVVRTKHNALEDARLTLMALKKMASEIREYKKYTKTT